MGADRTESRQGASTTEIRNRVRAKVRRPGGDIGDAATDMRSFRNDDIELSDANAARRSVPPRDLEASAARGDALLAMVDRSTKHRRSAG